MRKFIPKPNKVGIFALVWALTQPCSIQPGIARTDTDRFSQWRTHQNDGLWNWQQRHFEAAQSDFQQAVSACDQVDSKNWRKNESLSSLAGVCYVTRRMPQAIKFMQQALNGAKTNSGPDSRAAMKYEKALAELYLAHGQRELAEPLYKQVVASAEKKFGKDSPEAASADEKLAGFYLSAKDTQYDKAVPLLKHALGIWYKTYGSKSLFVGIRTSELADVYYKQGNLSAAQLLYEQAIGIWNKTDGYKHPGSATALSNLGDIYLKQKKYKEAESIYKRALSIRETLLGPTYRDTIDTIRDLAQLYTEQGDIAKANALLDGANIVKRAK